MRGMLSHPLCWINGEHYPLDHPLFVGLDCGGTGCRAAISAGAGARIFMGTGGPANLATVSAEDLEQALKTALEDACSAASVSMQDLRARCAGIYAGCAGWSAAEKRSLFAEILQRHTGCDTLELVADYELAYLAATAGEPGIVLSAGTGCVASAMASDGQIVRYDGLGWLIGDRGSAFHIGTLALRHAAASLQNGVEADLLTECVLHSLSVDGLTELLSVIYSDFRPSVVAALAQPAAALAQEGDAAATAVIAEAVDSQVAAIEQLHQRVYADRKVPVWLVGGLMHVGSFIRRELEQKLAERGCEVREAMGSAVEGAVCLAEQKFAVRL